MAKRVEAQMANEAILTQLAIHSLLSEKARKSFAKRTKKLMGD